MKFNFTLEELLPDRQGWDFVIEIEVVSFFPDAPSSNHKQVRSLAK
jgi:hypothetical protein